jgi:hypothetical protein
MVPGIFVKLSYPPISLVLLKSPTIDTSAQWFLIFVYIYIYTHYNTFILQP